MAQRSYLQLKRLQPVLVRPALESNQNEEAEGLGLGSIYACGHPPPAPIGESLESVPRPCHASSKEPETLGSMQLLSAWDLGITAIPVAISGS